MSEMKNSLNEHNIGMKLTEEKGNEVKDRSYLIWRTEGKDIEN